MNNENLNHLINNYIANFDVVNDEENREFYKWEAVKHFKDNFDIDAPNFAEMFKNAVKLTDNLIDNRVVQPTVGIVKLAERPELTEIILQMFKDLYADDGGDIDLRQQKIDCFVSKCDELLNTYENGKWKYGQNTRTAIFYLSLMYPDENYIFKSTEANKLRKCIDYADDFGSGASFSLKRYYRLCDELVKAIKANDVLINLHKARLKENMYPDENFHILAYDIIYCAISYNLYYNIVISKPTKLKTNSAEQIKQREERRNDVLAEINTIKVDLEELIQKRAEFDYFSTKGLLVSHKKFGEGTVVVHDNRYIVVAFSDGEKQFAMPQGFTCGFLSTSSEEAVSVLIEIAKIDDEIKQHEDKIYSLERELNRLQ